MDKNGNGFISKDEWDEDLVKVMKWADIKFNRNELAEMWNYLDSDGDGRVDFKEFQMATDDNEADERNRAKSIPLGLIRLIIFIYISSILHSGGGPFGGWGGR